VNAPDLSCSTLLLVDDEEANLDLLEGILAGSGLGNLLRTQNPFHAVELARQHRPDLVLLDLHMPGMTGFDVLRALREMEEPGDYRPVLVLTADVTPEARDTALGEGARDFLTKPFDIVEVLLRVRNLLETRQLYLQARRATEARERILGVVAHDLRNPLASITMQSEMVLQTLSPRSSAYVRDALGNIQQTSGQMYRLVQDLLDVAQLEGAGGRASVDLAQVDVHELLSTARGMLQPIAAGRKLTLDVDAPAGLRALADGARVVQVLSNLVGNAIKFTPAGGRITIGAAPDGACVRVSVADTGYGIPAEHLPHVFGAFWQGDTADRRGAGLGLSIASALVAAHGGRMWVESEVGQGTTVHFTVPAADVLAAVPAGRGGQRIEVVTSA
jgi:signal transduction histidine kinase